MNILSSLMPSSSINSHILSGFLLGKVNTQGRDLGWYDFALDRTTFYWAQAIKQSGPIPQHIAFCMDGNRRYARKKHLAAGEGHIAGFESMMHVLNGCYHLGVKTVTVYAFSIENFNRSPEESEVLFNLVRTKLWDTLIDGKSATSQLNWKIKFLGQRSLLDDNLKERMASIEDMTKDCQGMVVNICAPYTSRDDMAQAIAGVAQDAAGSVNSPKGNPSNEQNNSSGVKTGVHTSDDTGANSNIKLSSQDVNGEKSFSAGLKTNANSDVKSINSDANGSSNVSSSNANSSTNSGSSNTQTPGSNEVAEPGNPKTNPPLISLKDFEQHRYMAQAEHLDILVRTSGETRFSDFMTYECDDNCMYEIVPILWPELGLHHLVRIIFKWQIRQTSQKQTVKVSALRNGPPTISVSKKK